MNVLAFETCWAKNKASGIRWSISIQLMPLSLPHFTVNWLLWFGKLLPASAAFDCVSTFIAVQCGRLVPVSIWLWAEAYRLSDLLRQKIWSQNLSLTIWCTNSITAERRFRISITNFLRYCKYAASSFLRIKRGCLGKYFFFKENCMELLNALWPKVRVV